MPNSDDGQQEVVQEVEEEQEQEVEHQDEEQVVKRRITVSKIPMNRWKSWLFRLIWQVKSESYVVPVKVYATRVTSEKRMLRQVAFTEKVISTSFSELPLQQQHFVLDSNEKKVKAGKSSREGCVRKVLRRDRWRIKMIPVIRPGRVTEEKARAVGMRGLSEVEQSRE